MKKEYLRPCSDTVALSGVGGIMEVLHLGSSLNHNDAKTIECYTEDEDDRNEVENLWTVIRKNSSVWDDE
ncbi:hypothetical protein [Segatella buccae]